MIKKIFISQPMANKSKSEVLNNRNCIIQTLNKVINDEFEIIDSIINLPDNASPLMYLAESIKILDTADIIFFAKDWNTSRGCIIEYHIAQLYNKKFIVET